MYSGTTCLRDTNGGNGGCYSQDSICETDNYLCESFNLYGYEFVYSQEYICTEMSDGKSYYVEGEDYEMCDSTCNATTGQCD